VTIRCVNQRLTRTFSAAAASAVLAVGVVSVQELPASATTIQNPPRPDHVIVVVMENKNFDAIIGRPDEAPYLNSLAAQGAVFTNSFAVTHPSQPNYVALFSGSTQGLTTDDCPKTFVGVPNLGSDLIAAGQSFVGYSEGLASTGDTECGSDLSLGYVRKHNPWVDFTNVPASSNRTFSEFPSDYTQLPSVSFVIPNLCNDMHYCARDTGDAWLHDHLGGYAQWATTHNSLLVVTWDEDGTIAFGLGGDNNKVPTIFYGAHVAPGMYGERIDHYRVLRTIEDMYGLPYEGASANTTAIADVWN
jgi:phosphatidylinositol-3-phosphatase